MLYSEIIAVCSQIHTKHINTLCGQNIELLSVKLVVHIVTTGLQNSGCRTVGHAVSSFSNTRSRLSWRRRAQFTAFWSVTSCSLVVTCQSLNGKFWLHFPDIKVEIKQFPSKRPQCTTKPNQHGARSQKTGLLTTAISALWYWVGQLSVALRRGVFRLRKTFLLQVTGWIRLDHLLPSQSIS